MELDIHKSLPIWPGHLLFLIKCLAISPPSRTGACEQRTTRSTLNIPQGGEAKPSECNGMENTSAFQ